MARCVRLWLGMLRLVLAVKVSPGLLRSVKSGLGKAVTASFVPLRRVKSSYVRAVMARDVLESLGVSR